MRILRPILLILFVVSSFRAVAGSPLEFSATEWNFSTIREADGVVSHIFTATNRSDKPIVLLDVVSSCGCTAPEFSRKPILPGAKTEIKVAFDPSNRPGTFTKELGIFLSDRQKAATLTIRGTVIPRQKSIEELYPVEVGGGVRLTETLCAFSYIYIGTTVQAIIGYANTSDRSVSLELRPVAESGALELESPAVLPAQERGAIRFSYRISPEKPLYGTLRDSFEVWIDGRKTPYTLLAQGVGVDSATHTDDPKAPKAVFSENMLKFGAVKHNGSLQRLSFTLTNGGGSDLWVRAVENEGFVATTLAPGIRIAAGEQRRIEMILDPRAQQFGAVVDHLQIVTNDPARPMRRIRVTAIVEE